jgi:hypothetical protein
MLSGLMLSIPMKTLLQPARAAFSTKPGIRYEATSTWIMNSMAMDSFSRSSMSASRIFSHAGFRAKSSSVKK